MDFAAFIKEIEDNKWNVYGVEVYEKGVLKHSYKDTTENIYDIYSATKSIVSMAVGIVYDRGMIDFEKSILQYLPNKYLDKMTEEQKKTFERITVRRLLTMSVPGLPFRPEGDDYLEFSLNCKIDDVEKREFNYSNICTYLVCVALTEIIGSDLGEFIEREIFEKLDIEKYEYKRSPEGYFYGASAAKLCVHDLSKLGLLMYDGGVYNGKRILSKDYVKMSTSIQQMNREGGYGFYFWKYRGGFSINGKWKQKCYCLPDRGLVISFLSHIEDKSQDLIGSMEKYILNI